MWCLPFLGKKNKAVKKNPLHRFRPQVEALDQRIVPAARTWVGDFDTDFTDSRNWDGDNALNAGDDILLYWYASPGAQGGASAYEPELIGGDDISLLNVDVDSTFVGKTLGIGVNSVLTVTGTVTWDVDAAISGANWISVGTKGTLVLDDASMTATGGQFGHSSSSTFSMNVDVNNGSLLYLLDGFDAMYYTDLDVDSSIFYVSSASSSRLDADILTNTSTSIDIGTSSTMYLNQDSNSGSAGGFYGGGSITLSGGDLIRDVVDGAGQLLTVDMMVTLSNTNSDLRLDTNCSLHITDNGGAAYSINVGNGKIDLGSGSTLKVADGISLNTGTLEANEGSVTVDGSLTLSLGNIYVGTDGLYSTLNVTGNYIQSGGTLRVWLNGSTNGACSKLNVTGTAVLTGTGTTLITDVDNAVPGQNWTYTVLLSSGSTDTFDTWTRTGSSGTSWAAQGWANGDLTLTKTGMGE